MQTSLALVFSCALVLTACNPYRPGTMEPTTPNGAVRTTGCIDVAIDRVEDYQAVGFATELRMGNRCDAPVMVDLGQIRATMRHGDGRVSAMQVYDPDLELRPALLDARARGREVLEYQPIRPGVTPGPNAELCLDIAEIDRGEPSSLPIVACTPLGYIEPVASPTSPSLPTTRAVENAQ